MVPFSSRESCLSTPSTRAPLALPRPMIRSPAAFDRRLPGKQHPAGAQRRVGEGDGGEGRGVPGGGCQGGGSGSNSQVSPRFSNLTIRLFAQVARLESSSTAWITRVYVTVEGEEGQRVWGESRCLMQIARSSATKPLLALLTRQNCAKTTTDALFFHNICQYKCANF